MALKRDRDIDPEDEFLARFCRVVLECAQTPELISRVAADADFVLICRRLAADDAAVWFTAFCNRYQFNARRIRQRLQPVTRALRLGPDAAHDVLDYCALLGVSADADAQAIKRAYRQKAHLLHPDKRPDGDSRDFMDLQAAYVHLSHPELRRRLDRASRPGETWVESPPPSLPRPPARNPGRPGRLIVAAIALLVAAAFGVEFYVQQSSFSRDAPAPEHLAAGGDARPMAAPAAAGATAGRTERYPAEAEEEGVVAGPILPQPEGGAHAPAAESSLQPAAVPAAASDPTGATGRGRPEGTPARLERYPPEAAEECVVAGPIVTPAEAAPPGEPVPEKARTARKKKAAPLKQTLSGPPARSPASANAAEVTAAAAQTPAVDRNPPVSSAPAPVAAPAAVQPEAAACVPEAEAQAAAEARLEKRLNAFLETYCAVYADRDLSTFSALFTPDSTEQGKPFTTMLPEYRRTFSRIVNLDYRIRLISFTRDGSAIDLKGAFFASFTMASGKQGRSSGAIRMELFDAGDRLQVRRLEYEHL